MFFGSVHAHADRYAKCFPACLVFLGSLSFLGPCLVRANAQSSLPSLSSSNTRWPASLLALSPSDDVLTELEQVQTFLVVQCSV